MKANNGCQRNTKTRKSINDILNNNTGSSFSPTHNTFVRYASYNPNNTPAKYKVLKRTFLFPVNLVMIYKRTTV